MKILLKQIPLVLFLIVGVATAQDSDVQPNSEDSYAVGEDSIVNSESDLSSQSDTDTILHASRAETSQIVAHLTRARLQLISALNEFDRANKIASLDVVINTEQWRKQVSTAANDLKVAIAPQPGITTEGIKYGSQIKIFDNKKQD